MFIYLYYFNFQVGVLNVQICNTFFKYEYKARIYRFTDVKLMLDIDKKDTKDRLIDHFINSFENVENNQYTILSCCVVQKQLVRFTFRVSQQKYRLPIFCELLYGDLFSPN